ncbi:MAG TPA: L-threonylcarbamoyladenylate synthase [Actinomycetes bacterium]|nr:L-threonylcarbamoyladenylate synthase [Actinomycetes bacterium]
MRRIDCSDDAERIRGVELAVAAARRHQLVVFPTDAVYAVACDAFSPVGVERLNEAKGRLADTALPVMVGSLRAAKALIRALPPEAQAVIEGFWPGPLTAVCATQPTLRWDLGGDVSTVSVRMPLHPVALRVLQEVGPMAVLAANRVGEPAPLDCDAAVEHLGESVSLYLDAGPCEPTPASTVIDLTSQPPRLLREGALSLDLLQTVAPDVVPLAATTELHP